jgi:hypothetical protein
MFQLSSTTSRLVAAAAIFAAFTCSAGAQGVVTPDGELPGSFAQVSNVVELGNGRVAFSDARERHFLIGDFAKGTLDTVGRKVDALGPADTGGVYRVPGWVAHLAGDTLALVDFAAVRTTLWGEDGGFRRELRIPPVGGNTPVLVYDGLGRGYKVDYQAILGGGEPGRAVRPDSIPVLRIDLTTGLTDTVARLGTPDFGEARFGEQVQQVAKIFAPNDLFGVLPDGSLWVARGRSNSVEWRTSAGAWTRGKPHDYQKVPVTKADEERVMARLKERGLPAGVAVEFPFADEKPPFENALGRPNGEVWLQRSRTDEEQPMVYDVFGRDGSWQRDVSFPKGATVVGFGGGDAVYATMKDEKGGRTVTRYRVK